MAKNETDILQYTQQDGVAIITLNRPKSYNALSQALTAEIVKHVQQAEADDAVKVVVLTGNGKAFCAGIDLKEATNSPNVFKDDSSLNGVFKRRKKPMIGAINGYCITGGLELALCCDFLYASENAVFSDTHTKVGVIPGWGMTQRLPRLIGVGRAKEMSLAGQKINAETALAWGLVNRVFPADQLLPAAIQLATEMASNMQPIVQGVKELIDAGRSLSFDEAMDLEYATSQKYNDTLNVSVMSDKLNQLRGNK